jgi:hypothetical protein
MTSDKIHELTDGLVASIEKERSGDLSKNGGRLAKGMYLTLLEREGMRLKAEGQMSEDTPLQMAITEAQNALETKGVFDTNLGNDEVSIVRKAFVNVAEPLGGLEATFNDHFAVNPHTGMKLVNDAGGPFVRPITEVAVNKIYLISDYAHNDFDGAISFAKRVSEKALKKVNKIWKQTKSVNSLFGAINDIVETTDASDESISEFVNEFLGVKPDETPDYKNIQVPGHVYDGVYTRVRQMMSLILGFNGNEELLDKDSGKVMPGILIETILGTLLEPLEHGPWNILQTLLRAETITSEQAANFKIAWEQDGLAERWENVMNTGELPAFDEVIADDDD